MRKINRIKGKFLNRSNLSNSLNQNKIKLNNGKKFSMTNHKLDYYSTNAKTISLENNRIPSNYNSSSNLTRNIDNFLNKTKIHNKKELFISAYLSQSQKEMNQEELHHQNYDNGKLITK